MKRTLILLSACAFTAVSLSGCGFFKRDNTEAEDVAYFEQQNQDIPATDFAPAVPVKAMSAAPVQPALANIDAINVSRNPNSPEQLIVEVRGTVPNGCTQVGAPDYSVAGNTFKYTLPLVDTSNGGACTQAIVPFSKRMGLNASGQPLAPGSYTVDVNGNLQPFNI